MELEMNSHSIHETQTSDFGQWIKRVNSALKSNEW